MDKSLSPLIHEIDPPCVVCNLCIRQIRARKSYVDPIEDKVSSNEVSSDEKNDNHNIEGGGTQNKIATNL